MKIKTISDLLNYVETEEKAHKLIYYISILEEQLQQKDKELEARKQLINKQDKELWTLEHIIKEVREKIKYTISIYK